LYRAAEIASRDRRNPLVGRRSLDAIRPKPLPTSLDHSRNFTLQGEIAEADATDTETAQVRPRAAAAIAAVVAAHFELRAPLGLRDPGFLCHVSLSFEGSAFR